jgi:hypothetical protein
MGRVSDFLPLPILIDYIYVLSSDTLGGVKKKKAYAFLQGKDVKTLCSFSTVDSNYREVTIHRSPENGVIFQYLIYFSN